MASLVGYGESDEEDVENVVAEMEVEEKKDVGKDEEKKREDEVEKVDMIGLLDADKVEEREEGDKKEHVEKDEPKDEQLENEKKEEKVDKEGDESPEGSGVAGAGPSERSSPFHGFSTQSEAEDTSLSLDTSQENEDTSKENEDTNMEADDKSKEAEDKSKEGEDTSKEAEDTSKEVEDTSKEGENTSKEAEDRSKEAEDTSMETTDSQVRAKMCEDFGLMGPDVSEEDTEDTEAEENTEEKDKGKDSEEEKEDTLMEVEDSNKEDEVSEKPSPALEESDNRVATKIVVEETEEKEEDGESKEEECKEKIDEKQKDITMTEVSKLISPKKVHFSDEVEGKQDDVTECAIAPDKPVENIEELNETTAKSDQKNEKEVLVQVTPKSSKKERDRLKVVSPPLKLKIKFGKDKSGAITHGKIKSKLSPSSEEGEEAAGLPRDPESAFHGFPAAAVPPWVQGSFEGWDLTAPFRIKPTVFVSISSKKSAKTATATTPAPPAIPATSATSTPVTPATSNTPATSETPRLEAALRGDLARVTITPASTSKDKKKSNFKEAQYLRPFYEGWVREVVWRVGGGADVYYYPPEAASGGQRKKFRSPGELEAFLITSGSCLPMTFFTFKKEPVGGPEGAEVVRDSVNAKSPVVVAEEAEVAAGLGKRVSKPPEKLVAAAEVEAAATPSRVSKRVSRPPGKYAEEEPPAKVARTEERRPSKEETKKATAVPTPTKVVPPTTPVLLKLKTFSKMGADSRNQVVEDKAPPEEADVIMVEGEPETAPAPQITNMTITKVKKTQPLPALPKGTMISLPGAPTTAPLLRTFAPSNLPPVAAPAPAAVSITSLGAQAPRRPPAPQQPPAAPQQRNLKPAPKILRPSRPTQLPCSIHCLGVSAIPSLSCTACHCLYHPKCVGLPHSISASPNHKFYCNDCTPGTTTTPRTTTTPPQPKLPAPAPPPVVREPPPVAPRKVAPPVAKAPEEARSREARAPPPAPFPGQMMVNIAGRKFLVTPHPAPALESPPPSPPLLAVRGIAPVAPGAEAPPANRSSAAERLPVLLRPAEGGDTPSFEVEQTADGKLLLVPWDRSSAGAWPAARAGAGSWGNNFTNNLSGGYHAMMQVFRYLSVKERLQASSVCKLWRDIALHHTLWRTVSLKNTRVYNWQGFGQFLCQTKAVHLDVRKMLFVKERDATWLDIVAAASNFSGLRRLELPKVEGGVLALLAEACPRLESLHAPLVAPPLDLARVAACSSLRDLRVKASTGSSLKYVPIATIYFGNFALVKIPKNVSLSPLVFLTLPDPGWPGACGPWSPSPTSPTSPCSPSRASPGRTSTCSAPSCTSSSSSSATAPAPLTPSSRPSLTSPGEPPPCSPPLLHPSPGSLLTLPQAAEAAPGARLGLREHRQAGQRPGAPPARARGLQHRCRLQGRHQAHQEHQEAPHHPHLPGEPFIQPTEEKENKNKNVETLNQKYCRIY